VAVSAFAICYEWHNALGCSAMRRLRVPAVLLALVAVVGSAAVLVGGASAQGPCHIELRVDVFGDGRSWAKQGGLNAGRRAQLRARVRPAGCARIDSIRGRRVAGSGAIPPRLCGGTTTSCFWGVSARTMTAIDFQAYGRSAAGARIFSNIVRVAWAGDATVIRSGTYRVVAAGHRSTWTLSVSGNAITGSSTWACCPGARTDPLNGNILPGGTVRIVRDCTGQGAVGPCRQVYTGSRVGNTIQGSWTGTGGPGTWTLSLT
jgi:hypothetical protein